VPIEGQPRVDRDVDRVSIESIKVSIASIDRHSIAGVNSTHDPIFVRASKTIQFQQRALTLPLPSIPGCQLCPVAALRHHLALNPGSGFILCLLGPSFTLSHLSSFQFFFPKLSRSFNWNLPFTPHTVFNAAVRLLHLTAVFPLKLSSLWEIARAMPTLFTWSYLIN